MKITLNNTISIDDQTEVMHEVYPCEVMQKENWLYLIYQNDEQEKVVIKISQQELVMTRFGTPQTLMRFVAGGFSQATIPTPMGLQRLVTNSKNFVYDAEQQTVQLAYELLTSEDASLPLATYQMIICWA